MSEINAGFKIWTSVLGKVYIGFVRIVLCRYPVKVSGSKNRQRKGLENGFCFPFLWAAFLNKILQTFFSIPVYLFMIKLF